MRKVAATAMVALMAALTGVMFAAVVGAATATCTAKITISGPTKGALVLSPASVKAQTGDCVAFTNATTAVVNVTVAQGDKTLFSAAAAKGATVTGFTPKAAGTDSVAATEKVLLNLGAVHGSASITVTPAPKASPSDSPTPKRSGRHPSRSPKPADSPTPKHSKSHSPTPHATGIKLPPLPPLPTTGITTGPVTKGTNPVVAPGPTTAPAVTDSSTPVAAIFNGPIEPLTNNRRGLPEAIGVLVALGLATGWGRVLLAQSGPVDRRPGGDHRI